MLEIEIYAAGVRQNDHIMQLGHEFEMIEGLRYKVDTNHDIVYIEMDRLVLTLDDLLGVFKKMSLEPQIIGSIPSELRPKAKTQLLQI